MPYLLRGSLLFLVMALAPSSASRAQPIVDGVLDEWGDPLYSDAAGDGGTVDFGRLWGVSDADYLFLAFETGGEISLQNFNALTLYVDTDDDASTGEAIAGIGAEFSYAFGTRAGTATLPGQAPAYVDYRILGLLSAPTVTSDRFEVAFRRDAAVGGESLFAGGPVRVVLVVTSGGDTLPDAPLPGTAGGVLVPLRTAPSVRPAANLSRAAGHVRVMSYNVLRDRITQNEFDGSFRRLFQAIDPDVVALQEVYASDASSLAARLNDLLPGTDWYGAGVFGTDVMVLSRFPVLETVALCAREDVPTSCNVGALLDLGSGRQLYVVSMHPPCCTNDVGRQVEFDLLAAHLRDAQASGALPPQTPVIVAGDMNLVGDRRQVETLLSGAIVDTGRFGPPALPDADGTALADAAPRTTGRPATFTWVNDNDAFPPGRLDYIAYSDALLVPGNGFALYTPGLTATELTEYNLSAQDSAVSDHLPVVQDFAFRSSTAYAKEQAADAVPVTVWPNPAKDVLSVQYRLARPGPVQLEIVDALGRVVRLVEEASPGVGTRSVRLQVSDLAMGVYAVRVRTAEETFAFPFVVVR